MSICSGPLATNRKGGEAAHPSLSVWYAAAKAAVWRYFPDVKQTFSSADQVGEHTVFDISHNKARLVTYISYRGQKIFIKGVMSHAEYDEEKWK